MADIDVFGRCTVCGKKVEGTAGCPCRSDIQWTTGMKDAPRCPKCGGLMAINIILGDPSHPNSGAYCPKCDVKHDFEGTLTDARVLIAYQKADIERLGALILQIKGALGVDETTPDTDLPGVIASLYRDLDTAKAQAKEAKRTLQANTAADDLRKGLMALSTAAGPTVPPFFNLMDAAAFIRQLVAKQAPVAEGEPGALDPGWESINEAAGQKFANLFEVAAYIVDARRIATDASLDAKGADDDADRIDNANARLRMALREALSVFEGQPYTEATAAKMVAVIQGALASATPKLTPMTFAVETDEGGKDAS